MAKKILANHLLLKDGTKVKKEKFKTTTIEAHEYVLGMVENVEKISLLMQKAKQLERDLTDKYLKAKAEAAGLDHWDGFAVDYTVDEGYKVETRFSEIIAFDTNVSAGVQKIKQWVEGLQSNLNSKIKVILNDVLKVKSSGQISKSKLTKLTSYGFEDEEYVEACRLINENQRVIERKPYTDIYKRKEVTKTDKNDNPKVFVEWEKISTNYASM